MNLKKLFEMQKVLRERIITQHNLNGEDLLANFILALQVELGELANCWRGFKHWSVDKEMRREEALEEYADCLSFILEIGLELEYTITSTNKWKATSITEQFNDLFHCISTLYESIENDWEEQENQENYGNLFDVFISLGEMIGFTLDEVEAAYMAKNKINHNRQEQGY